MNKLTSEDIKAGAYLGGGHGAMTTLGRQDSIIRMAPPFVTWAESFELTKEQNQGEDFFFRPKTGLNLSEDLFFWSSPDFGP